MSFSDREHSLANGQPIRLYDFSRGPIHWAYTSADRDIEHNNQVFRARAVSDDGIRQTGEALPDLLTLTGPADLEVAQLYRHGRPSTAPELVVWDRHQDEAQALVAWIGTIADVNWPSDSRVQVKCRPLGSISKTGLSLAWSRNCPHTLYDQNCRVERERFRVPFTLERYDGRSVTGAGNALGGYPDGYFRGGYIEWDSGQGVIEQRGIAEHSGNTLVLVGGTSFLSMGLGINAFPGCDGLIQTCHDTFDNTDNCGAVKDLPGTSPFDGDPVW
ncbi:TPA: phage BR0599 family protein [Pseudomonas aeruginosa]|nr:phage BR0599 family protein [Pseudomonas aeruginosa]HEO1554978.1 phage BR0599 family protein [Pseudomonas aeruginosa]